jgi:hypothetical protein
MPEIGAAEWTMWQYLARDRSYDMELPTEEVRSLNKIRREYGRDKKGYKSHEVGITDQVDDEYILKVYGGGGPVKDWEIATMTIEDLMTGGQKIVAKDDDLRWWVLGLLATV